MMRDAACQRRGVLSLLCLLLVSAPLLVSCGATEARTATNTESDWSASVKAPARFRLRTTYPTEVLLPANQADLTQYMIHAGAHADVRDDRSLLAAPEPRPDSLCSGAPKAVVYGFPVENRFAPGYIAYVDGNGMVDCIEKYFSYLAF